jgi:hypothetical protein
MRKKTKTPSLTPEQIEANRLYYEREAARKAAIRAQFEAATGDELKALRLQYIDGNITHREPPPPNADGSRNLSYRKLLKSTSNTQLSSFLFDLRIGNIDMNPPYQRGLVWTLEQKVKLIDSLAWGIALPAVYLRELPTEYQLITDFQYEVLDGKQRLSTIQEFFLDDGFAYEGRRFSEMSTEEQWTLKSASLGLIQVSELTEVETIEVYERLNFCGVPHER